MALTDKKRRFVAALQSGLSGAKAAIQAGYSENGAAQAAARLKKDPDVMAALARNVKVNNVNNKESGATDASANDTDAGNEGQNLGAIGLSALGLTSDPKKVLVAIMNDQLEDPKLRLDAAKALMPFTHPKVADQGKKDARADAAKKAGAGRFAPPPPPLRMIPGGK
ncbi:terminase small subunit [Allopusillimonas ginsengisoli]|uniref:terminase small subunit n=1 Tax=Allopusillimonas ginsengisoli TaxID=453575 RepID=UPI0010203F38|nr:terminase small subunit [Allopusillimonas ginsengisoli]TEA79827.1 terminase small subunit [Allopusillimonas ginsengisoli]